MRPLALLIALLSLAAPASAAEIVVYEDSDAAVATETAERERELGFEADRTYTRALDGFVAELTPEQERALRADPEVKAVIPDRPVRALAAVTAQPGGVIPPGVRRAIQAPAGTVREAATSAVAVLDTGVDLEHPDLNVTAGPNCATAGPPDDLNDHGTHVAGTIAAKDDGVGVVGVAPGTEIIAVKVLDDNGGGSTSTVLCGIEWVIANRAARNIEVVNMSLGGPGARSTCASDPEHLAYCRLANAGITTVVAAGNDGWDLGDAPPDIPASYPEVLTVSAIADTDGVSGAAGGLPCLGGEADDRYASFSNYATRAADVEHMVAAPGVCIRSTVPGGGTDRMSGTSMAAPHVAGLVALCHGEAGAAGPCATLSPAQVIRKMVEAAGGATETGFAADLANPSHRYGPFAVLPSAPIPTPAPEPEPEPDEELIEPPRPQPEVDFTVPETPAQPEAPAPAPEPTPPPTAETALIAPSEPTPVLAVTPARLRRFLRSGLAARVTCAPGCRVTFRLLRPVGVRSAGRRLPAVLAQATSSGGRTAVLKPARTSRRALANAKRLTVTVQADVSTPAGTVRLRRTLTLRTLTLR